MEFCKGTVWRKGTDNTPLDIDGALLLCGCSRLRASGARPIRGSSSEDGNQPQGGAAHAECVEGLLSGHLLVFFAFFVSLHFASMQGIKASIGGKTVLGPAPRLRRYMCHTSEKVEQRNV